MGPTEAHSGKGPRHLELHLGQRLKSPKVTKLSHTITPSVPHQKVPSELLDLAAAVGLMRHKALGKKESESGLSL
jgi:hypothetical protein